MNILVPIKRVIDYQAKIRIKADNSGVETDHVNMSINPFDEIALEEAIRLKEQGIAKHIIAVSIGKSVCQENLRNALALGADQAILIEHTAPLEPLNIAKLLAVTVKQQQVDLVIMGKQAIDDDCNQTAQMLAARLDWPQATFVSKLVIQQQRAEVTREVDEGLQVEQIELPAVISVDLRLNEPRYASLPNIMKAKSKPLEQIKSDQLIDNLIPHQQILSVNPPEKRKSGIKVDSIQSLMDILKNKDKVIS